MITTREPDQEPSADQPETNAMAQNTQDTTAEDTTAQNITSTLDALHLDPPITPPETVESLRAYEKEPGEAQKFLGTTKFALHTLIYFVSLTDVFADRMVHGFTWPASMLEVRFSGVSLMILTLTLLEVTWIEKFSTSITVSRRASLMNIRKTGYW